MKDDESVSHSEETVQIGLTTDMLYPSAELERLTGHHIPDG